MLDSPRLSIIAALLFLLTFSLMGNDVSKEADLKKVLDSLVVKLGDDEFGVRETAEEKLKALLKNPDTLDTTLSHLRKHLDRTENVEVKRSLERLTSPYIEWGITGEVLRKFPNILGRLTSFDTEVRLRMVKRIAERREPSTVRVLIRALKDWDANVRACAAWGLGRIKDKRAVEPLADALTDESAHVREFAAEALGRLGDKRAVDALIKILKNEGEKEHVRSFAAEALGELGDERAVEPLIEALREGEGSLNALRYATEALSKIGKSAVEPLLKALKDKNRYIRGYAAWALGRIKDKRAVEPLIKALKDRSECVRRNAAYALGEIKDKRAVEPLIEALKDIYTSELAAEALKKITGRNFGEDYQRWLDWLKKQKK